VHQILESLPVSRGSIGMRRTRSLGKRSAFDCVGCRGAPLQAACEFCGRDPIDIRVPLSVWHVDVLLPALEAASRGELDAADAETVLLQLRARIAAAPPVRTNTSALGRVIRPPKR